MSAASAVYDGEARRLVSGIALYELDVRYLRKGGALRARAPQVGAVEHARRRQADTRARRRARPARSMDVQAGA